MEGLDGSENEEGRDGLMELGGCGWPDLENGEEGGGFGWWFGSGGDPKEEETVGWRRRRGSEDGTALLNFRVSQYISHGD